MLRLVLVTMFGIALAAPATAVDIPGMSAERMHGHIEHLSSDRLEGRAPGSEGETLALDYMVRTFRDLGYEPGNPDGTFLQEVPLFSYTVTNAPNLTVASTDGAHQRVFQYGPEFMGWTLRQQPSAEVAEAEMVFVGYGVVAPEYDWNDFKDFDVAGRIVVMLVNDPPHPDESLFGGRAMTYYGRWTYKFEIAAEMGAAGAIVIHTTEAAGYPWAVVENSWQGAQFDIVRDDAGASRCAMESWITEDAARELFAAAGQDFDDLVDAAVSRDFQPVPLGLTGSVRIHNRTRAVKSHNVVARLPGNDSRLQSEHVIYTAHWDHLGVGNVVEGDSVYNGALDNATGVAALLEVASAFAQERPQLKRSILFILTTAEESGLLGARHYCENPLYPLNKAVATINVDGMNVWGRTSDVVIVGYGQSDLDEYLERAVTPMDRFIVPDSEPEKGYYYRSDHFPFAKMGVPALYADSGIQFRDRPEGWGMERRKEYVQLRYHKPHDEYDPSWDLSGAMEDMAALFSVGRVLAVSDRYPRWSETSEFRRVREESLRGSR